jgi:hypothetical protein
VSCKQKGALVPPFFQGVFMNIKRDIEVRIRVLENKLTKSIPAARNNEIRGEIMGLKWVLERL